MVAIANVKLWNHLVGVIFWDELQELGIFEFDKNFSKLSLDISPLLFPLSEFENGKLVFSFPDLNRETFKGLPGFLAESLPQEFGNKILNIWHHQKKNNKLNFSPVDQLNFISDNGFGAFEFESINRQIINVSKPFDIHELMSFVNDASKNQIHSTNYDDYLFQITAICKGKSPKAIVTFNPKTNEIRTGKTNDSKDFDYWLMKLNYTNDENCKIEFAYYLMALDCGISISESKLLTKDGHSNLIIKRFDRQQNQKIHFQTLCGVAHFDSSKTGFYSYEQVFEILRQMKLPYSDSEELFRRMVFNVMSNNKNYSTQKIGFLMFPNGKWQLSPAFGMRFSNDNEMHQVSINSKIQNILLDDLLAVAKNANIKKPKKIIERCNEVLFNWDIYAQKAGISIKKIREIERELLIFD